MKTDRLCVVAPCFNEQDTLPTFLSTVCPILASLSLEARIVLVNDGSTDGTLSLMREAHKAGRPPAGDVTSAGERPREEGLPPAGSASPATIPVDYVSLSRNFGKEAALLAGMEKALALGATQVIVMDVDLQDPPELIPQMLDTMRETGCDVVATYRQSRVGEPPIRSWFAHRFYRLMNRLSSVEMRDGARDFRLMTRPVVQAIVRMPETQRFSKGLFSWVGFETAWIGYENVERAAGQTHWSFWSLVAYALDGIMAFSVVPITVISVAGLVVFLLAMAFLVFIVVRAALFGDPVAGWPSLVCIITLLSGLQLLGIGVLGLYLSKVYSEVKRRPMYLVAEES